MKTDSFDFIEGSIPILISMPHNGLEIPSDIKSDFTPSALNRIDTDWYMDKLYQFAVDKGCFMLSPKYSRYVIDLNRPKDDENLYPGQDTTSLCPTTQFDKSPIYKDNCEPTAQEIENRVSQYWQPYHSRLQETLQAIEANWGIALLFEAHSIKSKVPRFFTGQLPDFNFGDYNHQSCSKELSQMVDNWNPSDYSKVFNGRFKGGYITRAYGQPKNNIHSIQLELSQATYLNEESLDYDLQKVDKVKPILEQMFEVFYSFVNKNTNR